MNLPNVLVNLTSNSCRYWVTNYFVLKPWTIWCIFNLRSLVSVSAVARRQWRGSFKHLDDLLMSAIEWSLWQVLLWTKDWVQSSARHFSICILHFFYCLSFKKQPKKITWRLRFFRSNIICKFCFFSWQSVIYLLIRIFTSLWDRHEHTIWSWWCNFKPRVTK